MTAPTARAVSTTPATAAEPAVRRIGHPLVARRLEVTQVEELSRSMRRITLDGPDLAGFVALGPADHVKVFFPGPLPALDGHENLALPVVEDGRWVNHGAPGLLHRDYTVRTFDPAVGLVLDMVVHAHGPAGRWTGQARPGQPLGVLGPRGSMIPPTDRERYVLAADETGLPALLNWLDVLPAAAEVEAFVEVDRPADHVALPERRRTQVTWLHRSAAEPGTTTLLPDAVAQVQGLEPGRVWAWAGAETTAVRAIRQHLSGRGLGRESFAMTGYWRRGEPNFDHHSEDA
ncbi:siderophore-interacting protein [Actinotalea sp. C106]|uniref:siderophore-interacting protein n=1 Tax=Actinotalea sp. C106 TaxID=2908644 RepID=UPI00202841F9|nr:siderophore-interacting protein [Actinotalea sp. C106]